MTINESIMLSEADKELVKKIEKLKGNWDTTNIDDVINAYRAFDELLKRGLLSLARGMDKQEAYSEMRGLWLEAIDGMREYCESRGMCITPDDEGALHDLLDLAFFKPEKLISVSAPQIITPVISVVMPVYKSWPYIFEALRSVYEQTYQDLEVIIIEKPGNPDPLSEIISLFGDERTTVFLQERSGKLGAALNQGIRQARGEFIARMDADDICLPQRFEKQLAFFDANPDVEICGTCVKSIHDKHFVLDIPLSHEAIKNRLYEKIAIAHDSVMWRRDALISRGLWYREDCVEEDYYLWCEAAWKVKLANLPEILMYYRCHSNNLHKSMTLHQYTSETRKIHNFMVGLSGGDMGLDSLETRMERLEGVRGNRSFVVWGYGSNGRTLEAHIKNMSAPYRIADQYMQMKGKLADVSENTILIEDLEGNADKYYVIVSPENPPAVIAQTLERYGYQREKDYTEFFKYKKL